MDAPQDTIPAEDASHDDSSALSRRAFLGAAAATAAATAVVASPATGIAATATRSPARRTTTDPLAAALRSSTATNPADFGVLEAAAHLRKRNVSARELLKACQERIERRNGGSPSLDGAPDAVNAWVRLYPTLARKQASAADARLRREGAKAPLLCGVPIGVKDLYAVAGVPVTGSSRVLEGNVPKRDSVAWARLAGEGMVLVGHTHTHEFALGTTTDQCGNPYALNRIAGGSSGGSAVALASGMIPAALGTDTGASLRVPAAMNGTTSIKPTHGTVPIDGIVPFSPTYDTAGPMARSAADAALLLQAMARGGGQVTAQIGPIAEIGTLALMAERGARPLAGITVAITPRATGLDPDVLDGYRRARRALRSLGAKVIRVPTHPDASTVNYFPRIWHPEVWAYHRTLADRADRYGPAKGFVTAASRGTATATDYVAAQAERDRVTAQWERWFRRHRVDVLIEPTAPVTAPLRTVVAGGTGDPTRSRLTTFVSEWTTTGFPVVAIPTGLGRRTGLPVGVSLVSPRGRDAVAVSVAVALQATELPPLPIKRPKGARG